MRIVGRRIEELLIVVIAASLMLGACRRKETNVGNVTGASASPQPNQQPRGPGAVSMGVLDGLRRELQTAQKADPKEAERVQAVRPVLSCVEAVSPTEWRAHFGYANSSGDEVAISVGGLNRFWPHPPGREQPKVFAPGSQSDVVQAAFSPRGVTAWILGSAFAVANSHATPCSKSGGR